MAYIEFKEGEKHSGKLTDTSDTPDVFADAGYVLTDNDLIVDIDDVGKDAIKRMLSLFNIATETVWTTRGAHLYFKKPSNWRRAQGISALGFKVEYKHKKNTKAVTVKNNGVLRDRERVGTRETLPWFLIVDSKYKDMVGFGDGDGRNNALYAHKRQITGMEGWQTVLAFINEYVFDEPLDAEEMGTLTRYEIAPEAEKGNEYQIADYLIKDLDFLEYGGQFFFKENGEDRYKTDEPRLLKLVYDLCPGVQTRYVDEVVKQMEYRCRIIPSNTVFKIRFLNGYLFGGEFVPIVTDEFTPYNLDVEYDPEAEPVQVVDDYIDHLTRSDPDYRKLLMEVLGHTLIVDPEFKRVLAKFFVFVGSGGNGKGTLLQIIKSILGVENVTGMGIRELSDERYLVTLKGKLANLGDDIQDSAINDADMKMLKNISTCDYISTRELYKQAVSMYFTASLIFTSNHLIKSFEKGESYKRRVSWLPMYTTVEEGKKDPLFITKLTSEESIRYWIRLIVEGYVRLHTQLKFTEAEIVSEFNARYHEENNPYLTYLEDIDVESLIDLPIRDGYDNAKDWCEDNGEEFKQKMFRDTLLEMYNINTNGVKKINGKATRVFVRVTD